MDRAPRYKLPAWPRNVAGTGAARIWSGLALALAIAAAMRLGGLPHDLPYSYFGDELQFVRRSMALGTGDLNPHWFNSPAGLMYVLLACYGLFYGVGAALGWFASPEAFGAYFLADMGVFLLIGRTVVMVSGVAAVALAHRLAAGVFRSASAGFAVALTMAVLAPAVESSQVVKTDVPAGLFVLAGVLAYLPARHSDGLRPLVLASGLAGLAIGVKFYGVILLPVIGVLELARPWTHGTPAARALGRATLGALVPALVFLVVSPYSVLDPTFGAWLSDMAAKFLAPGTPAWEVDATIWFDYGPSSVPGAAVHLLGVLAAPDALGPLLTPLCGIGAAAVLADRETRWWGSLLVGPVLVFAGFAVTLWAYHAAPRHLHAVYPLLLCLAYAGAFALVARLPPLRAYARPLAAGLVVLAALPSAALSLRHNADITRLDSRKVAAEWIAAHVPPESRILLDEYGPFLVPGPASAARQRALLDVLGERDAFTIPEATRLELLRAYPAARHFNVDELGHQWWLPRELSDEELRRSPAHRQQSNPLKSRQPRTLDEYRAAGYEYVITNSIAQSRYATPAERRDFPSFARFYGELAALTPVVRFDPAAWNGKGPIVDVYRLSPHLRGGTAVRRPDGVHDRGGAALGGAVGGGVAVGARRPRRRAGEVAPVHATPAADREGRGRG